MHRRKSHADPHAMQSPPPPQKPGALDVQPRQAQGDGGYLPPEPVGITPVKQVRPLSPKA
jgi:magnesium chelatase subunit I